MNDLASGSLVCQDGTPIPSVVLDAVAAIMSVGNPVGTFFDDVINGRRWLAEVYWSGVIRIEAPVEKKTAHQMRKTLIRERETTRWRVMVHACGGDTATSQDGTPCLDTHTKAGFSSIAAAEAWVSAHPCRACLVIVDAHLEVPLPDLIEMSKWSMAEERARLYRVAEQRRLEKVCGGCQCTGLDRPVHFRPNTRDEDGNPMSLCNPCALAKIAPITDDDVLADRLTMHINRMGYDAKYPDEIQEYLLSETEWDLKNG